MTNTTRRIPKVAWLQAGLTVLSDIGPNGLTIERICTKINRSKGSFYFHFSSVDTYKEDLLSFWEEMHTDAVEEGVREYQDPIAQRRALPGLAAVLSDKVERAIRLWSQLDEKARAATAQVDERRIAFVANIIMQTDNTTPAMARRLATIEYAAFLGFQHLLTDATEAERQSIYESTLYLISPNLAKMEE
ncbi:MAG: helix-turn-helix domain-containing protein [Pseudomonadota bacterium]